MGACFQGFFVCLVWLVGFLLSNSAAVDRLCLGFSIVCHCTFGTDSSGFAGLKGKCICNFTRCSEILPHRSCTILLPHQQFMRKCVSPQHVLQRVLDICLRGE